MAILDLFTAYIVQQVKTRLSTLSLIVVFDFPYSIFAWIEDRVTSKAVDLPVHLCCSNVL